MKFKLQLGTIPDKQRVAHIDFYGESYQSPSPVFSLFPEKIDYGHLLAYLFRRFGYPNTGWDGYKNLVSYILTTPLPDFFLRITPYVGGHVEIGFQFMATEDDRKAIRLWKDADRIAWETRRLNWVEAKGLPNWMPDWVTKCDQAVQRDFGVEVKTWRDSIHWAAMYLGHNQDPEKDFPEVAAFLKSLDEFPEPKAEIRLRSGVVEEWADNDPLKSLAVAAIAAMKDLSRPIRVRDCQINAYGPTDNLPRELKEPDVAGWPAGWLYNQNFKEMSDIGDIALKLGKGNLKRGLKKVIVAAGGKL